MEVDGRDVKVPEVSSKIVADLEKRSFSIKPTVSPSGLVLSVISNLRALKIVTILFQGNGPSTLSGSG